MKYLLCSTDSNFSTPYEDYIKEDFSHCVQIFSHNYTYILNTIAPSNAAYIIPITSRGLIVSHNVLEDFPIKRELIHTQVEKFGITTKYTDKKFLPVGSSIYLTISDNIPVILTVTMYTLQDVSKTPNPVYSLYSATILGELNEISTIISPILCTNAQGKMTYREFCLQVNNSLNDNFQIRPICSTPDSKVTFITKHNDVHQTQPDIKANEEFRPNLLIKFKKKSELREKINKNKINKTQNKNKNKNKINSESHFDNPLFNSILLLPSEILETLDDPTYSPSSCSSTEEDE